MLREAHPLCGLVKRYIFLLSIYDRRDNMPDELTILKAIMHMAARSAFSEEEILSIVSPRKGQEKHLAAYNLCNGTRKQGDIAENVGLDKGNFSKAVSRWVSQGILIKLGEGAYSGERIH
jgi:DNA-binding MarR family transcriptional regulator